MFLAPFLGLLAWVLFWDIPVDPIRFDAERWRAVDRLEDGSNRDRQRMREDLVENHLSPGMSVEEVKQLLGAPVWEGPIRSSAYSAHRWREELHELGGVLEYWIGWGRKPVVDLDSEWLFLRFTQDRTYIESAVIRH